MKKITLTVDGVELNNKYVIEMFTIPKKMIVPSNIDE